MPKPASHVSGHAVHTRLFKRREQFQIVGAPLLTLGRTRPAISARVLQDYSRTRGDMSCGHEIRTRPQRSKTKRLRTKGHQQSRAQTPFPRKFGKDWGNLRIKDTYKENQHLPFNAIRWNRVQHFRNTRNLFMNFYILERG